MPVEPVSTMTESIVWQLVVPGTQSVTLMNGTSTESVPFGPALTITGATLPAGVEPSSPDAPSEALPPDELELPSALLPPEELELPSAKLPLEEPLPS